MVFKTRAFNILAFNVTLNLDPRNINHKEEINEVNGWEANTVSALRWVKPLDRRSPNQRSAHLVLSFNNPLSANRAIASRVTICNKKCQAERIKKEPLRCLKCQGWNHMARDCPEAKDVCRNCAENHRTSKCLSPHKTRCVSCKANDHASWIRE